ncbi:MAG TPA: M14 metallopeptidase family protein [Gemmatimonadaceae bacterium]|nr:M14 metallopeptidase family protein [Gemmatimonadaceae bacterium]
MPAALHRSLLSAAIALALATNLLAQNAPAKLTTPNDHFGHEIGADYVLPDYTQFMAYWQKLAGESDRMALDTIGLTAEGRPQLMAIVTSPANHQRLDRFKEIARRLALADGLSEEEARRLSAEGKAVVWIDGGLHATEVLGAQQLTETVWQLVSRTDPETMRFLDDVIVLAVHANPDGMELVSDWYMRTPERTKRSTAGVPRLYQKYIGHDNNRDFYMVTQPETQNMARVLFREWFPQIMYNHHQTGPSGTVLFAPPFRDPFNYFYDPLVVTGIDLVGASMHNRFVLEEKPGATTRRGANYSTWWNGGLRTTVYFHNMIGLLTETIGNPTPIEIPFLPQRQLASSDLFAPVPPGPWKFRQSVDYSVTANRAVLDVASRHREQFLYNIYKMGRNSIERGSRDHWTVTPSDIERVRVAATRSTGTQGDAARPDAQRGGGIGARGLPMQYWEMLHAPGERDPRGYIIPSDQPDFPTATKFVDALLKVGVTVHRATAPFTAGGKSYPAGSYVVKTAQAFRPHVLDMFEPQDHPNDFQYPGGPPIPPYDNAGWTLAYQMGIKFDRILDGFDGPFAPIEGTATVPPGRITGAPNASAFVIDHRVNDAALVVNRLLKGGHEVSWLPDGRFLVNARSNTRALLQQLATQTGVSFEGVRMRAPSGARRLSQPRVALWDTYGGSMPSGWVRWILERYEFPHEVVFAPQLDTGALRAKYDVIIFVDGAIPERDGAQQGGFGGGGSLDTSTVPAEWRARMGRVTVARTVPQLRRFLEEGGTILTVGGSTNLAKHLGLPVSSALVEQREGREQALAREKYYVPGSVLQVRVDSTLPIAHGLPSRVDVFFDDSPAFRLGADAESKGVRRIAWFDTDAPLRSGWAWGQQYLKDATAMAQAPVGRGTLYLFGPEITFRAQPHGTFKLLFNGILLGGAR